jgi:uncharacterized protein (DUF58 family)
MTDDEISPELLDAIRRLQLRTRHLVTDVLMGDYTSAFKGRGMEFDEVREYQPGDDVRRIDWNVTARTDVPHIKVHKEERELTVMLVVDVSASTRFGTRTGLKRDVAVDAAAMLAWAAVRGNDRVGMILFDDRVRTTIPARKGTAHVWRVIRALLSDRTRADQTSTDYAAALDQLNLVQKRRAVVFLLSDLLGEGWRDAIKRTAARHDVVAVHVTDPWEIELPDVGPMLLEDAETGRQRRIDTSSRAVRDAWRAYAAASRARRQEALRAARVGQIELRTDQDIVDPIVRFFRGRREVAWS